MTKDAIQTFSYRISQASRSGLVVILYDMADTYLEDAKSLPVFAEGADEQKLREYGNALRKCGQVIDLLIKGLDFQYEISNNLFQIYLHIKRTLVTCMACRDLEQLKVIQGMLHKLRNSFYEVSKTDKSGPLMKNTQQIYSGLTYSSMGGSNEVAGNVSENRGFMV